MTCGRRWTRRAAGALCLAAAACSTATSPSPAPAEVAASGSLLIVGGGPISDAILRRFVELAGGPGRARIAIFPMASERADAGLELAEDFRRLGAFAERVVYDAGEARLTPPAASPLGRPACASTSCRRNRASTPP